MQHSIHSVQVPSISLFPHCNLHPFNIVLFKVDRFGCLATVSKQLVDNSPKMWVQILILFQLPQQTTLQHLFTFVFFRTRTVFVIFIITSLKSLVETVTTN